MGSTLDEVVVKLGRPSDVLIVTATIAGAAGVDAVNERGHRGRLSDGGDELAGFFGLGQVVAIDPGERTMQVQFDGDGEPKTLGDEHLVDLDLAYAVTCHRMHAKRIVIPIYETRLLERSWLYTPSPAPKNRSSSSAIAARSATPWRSLPLRNAGSPDGGGPHVSKLSRLRNLSLIDPPAALNGASASSADAWGRIGVNDRKAKIESTEILGISAGINRRTALAER